MKKYLFIPIMPTPNGRFHIGHISGPYLKSDILARNLRLHGHDAKILSGVDTYEAHVCLKAYQEEDTPENVNSKYRKLMLADLEAFDIRFDNFIDPLETEHHNDFKNKHQELYQSLKQRGYLTQQLEQFYKRADGSVLNGCWIRGTCSQCSASMKAFYCEECGANLRPEEIINPYFIPALEDGEKLEKIEEYCDYIKVDPKQLEAKWKEMNLPEHFIEIARTFLKKENNKVRMTAPDKWGIQVEGEQFNEDQVMFSYTTMYFYSAYCAKLYQEAYGSDVEPFHPDSDVTTIAGFGVDNTNAYLVAFLGAAYGLGIKPFDYFLTNYFFQLDDKKIASSSGHAIWAEDLVKKHNYPSDAARFYLTLVNPQHAQKNFTLDEFDAFYKDFYQAKLLHAISVAFDRLGQDETSLSKTNNHQSIRQLLQSQQLHMSFPTPDLKKAIEPIYAILEQFELISEDDLAATKEWLLGLSLLLHSIAPQTASEINQRFKINKQDALDFFEVY